MKKLFLIVMLIAGVSGIGNAQESVTYVEESVDSLTILKDQLAAANERLSEEEMINRDLEKQIKWQGIWGNRKYTQLFYGLSASAKQDDVKFDSSWNFGVAKGTSYLFPSRPIAGLLKIGFDIRWVDISATKYKKNYSFSGEDYGYEYDEEWYEDLEEEGLLDIGHYDIHVGAFGIGPVVSVAPFSNFDNYARFLRATLYFHYQPTFGLHLLSEDGDIETSMAYCNMMDFGGKIQYRRISLGIEGRWGSGKYSSLLDSDDFDDLEGMGGTEKPDGKVKRKFSSTRVYIAFTF